MLKYVSKFQPNYFIETELDVEKIKLIKSSICTTNVLNL